MLHSSNDIMTTLSRDTFNLYFYIFSKKKNEVNPVTNLTSGNSGNFGKFFEKIREIEKVAQFGKCQKLNFFSPNFCYTRHIRVLQAFYRVQLMEP